MAKQRGKSRILHLRLYIAGNGPNSTLARKNISIICREHFPSAYQLEVVDLLEFPSRALADGIVVTPTLLKLQPLPRQLVIGNLNDHAQVVLTLQSS